MSSLGNPPPEPDGSTSPPEEPTPVPPPVIALLVPSPTQALADRPLAIERPSENRRWILLPLVLFVVTCLSTFWAGTTSWQPIVYLPTDPLRIRAVILAHWDRGLTYMACVLAILLTHEMGHFLTALLYRVPASWPYFIPFPFSPLGTMGAVIGMEGYRANRRQIFDIGLAGPVAGLLVVMPILWIGIAQLNLQRDGFGGVAFQCPILARWMLAALHPEYAAVDRVWLSQLNPYFMAGWVGLLITGLNMLPISQLDGGHVIYGLFGRRAHWVARAFLLVAIAFVVLADVVAVWLPMIVLVTLIGTDHPPTADDAVPLGWIRRLIGYASLLIPLFCFPPRLAFLQNF